MRILAIACIVLVQSLNSAAQTPYPSKLTGVIYDQFGAVIPEAKITATSSGKSYSGTSNVEGAYTLTLPFFDEAKAKYDITVERWGFKRAEIKGYVVARSGMNLDIALESIGPVIEDRADSGGGQPLPEESGPKPRHLGIVNGAAKELPKPILTVDEEAVCARRQVKVEVQINESGKVISAKAIAGDKNLWRASEDAAHKARFGPSLIDAPPVKMWGYLVYNFQVPSHCSHR